MLAVSTCFLFGGKGFVSHAAEGGGEKFYGDIARALADYFADFRERIAGERNLDVVPSDVGLGFVMLRHGAEEDAGQEGRAAVGGEPWLSIE